MQELAGKQYEPVAVYQIPVLVSAFRRLSMRELKRISHILDDSIQFENLYKIIDIPLIVKNLGES